MKKVDEFKLALEITGNSPVVLLTTRNSEEVLPIWIGSAEALAIATGLSGAKPMRPMTHDLLCSILDGIGTKLEKVVITSLKNNTYFALIYLQSSAHEMVVIDARPSDSIAIALKTKADVYISDDVPTLSHKGKTAQDLAALEKRLRIINPQDINKLF
ncbi:bifunctional nuclease family protein [bacterium]|nr:bifunctional nuclease family protein [bacterium]